MSYVRPYGHKDGRLIGEPPTPRGIGLKPPAPAPGRSPAEIAAQKEQAAKENARRAKEAADKAAWEERNQAENEALRRQRQANLDAEKKAKSDAQEAAWEAELTAEHKERERALWLIDHPLKTAADFETVWPHVLTVLKERTVQEAREAQRQRMRCEYGAI